MNELRRGHEPFDEVESLVRMAATYVQPSRDLRPKVLEAARLEYGERRARRRIGRAALFAALWGLFTTYAVDRLDTPQTIRQLAHVAADAHIFAPSETSAAHSDGGWALVDAYTELRRRQAAVLRM